MELAQASVPQRGKSFGTHRACRLHAPDAAFELPLSMENLQAKREVISMSLSVLPRAAKVAATSEARFADLRCFAFLVIVATRPRRCMMWILPQ